MTWHLVLVPLLGVLSGWRWGAWLCSEPHPLRGSHQSQAIVVAEILSPNGKPQIKEELWLCSLELREATSPSWGLLPGWSPCLRADLVTSQHYSIFFILASL